MSQSRSPSAAGDAPDPVAVARPWAERKPGQLVGRGHMAGDFLEAYDWKVLEEGKGWLRIQAHLPDHVKNPRGQLFGGFTPTYVDFVALFTVRSGERGEGEPRFRNWLATTNMRIDYFEPVQDTFVMESRLVVKRGRTNFVETRFFDESAGRDDASRTLCVFAVTTMREVALDRPLGDG